MYGTGMPGMIGRVPHLKITDGNFTVAVNGRSHRDQSLQTEDTDELGMSPCRRAGICEILMNGTGGVGAQNPAGGGTGKYLTAQAASVRAPRESQQQHRRYAS